MHTQNLQHNLFLFILIRIFFKRSYLPIIAIFAVTHADVSIEQIGIIAAITSLIALLIEIPSGYISDRIGHKNALILGGFFVMLAPLWMIIWPTFWGVLLESVFFFVGYAFHSGTLQAFLHETLLNLNQEKNFGKINAKAQQIGLIVFVSLVTIVPTLYQLHILAPFYTGFILQGIVLIASLMMVSPPQQKQLKHIYKKKTVSSLLKKMLKNGELLFFFMIGLLTGILHKLPDYREIYLQDIDVPIIILGVIVALGNLLGAALMSLVTYYENMSHKIFYTIDILIILTLSLLLGIWPQPFAIGLTFIAIVGYARMRQVVMHAHLFKNCPTKVLKATYVSVFELFSSLHRMWLPIILGLLIGKYGSQNGYLIFAIMAIIFTIPLYWISIKKYKPL